MKPTVSIRVAQRFSVGERRAAARCCRCRNRILERLGYDTMYNFEKHNAVTRRTTGARRR
jgi:hypothetical protein